MALDVFVFTQTKDSTGTNGNDDTIACGFAPKAAVIIAIAEADTEDEHQDHAQGSIGFTDGINQRCSAWQEEHAVARSDTRQYLSNAEVIINFSDGGASIEAQGRATFSGNDLVIDWFVNDTRATHYHGIVYGGSDITGVQVSTLLSPTSAISVDYAADADVRNITDNEGILFVLGGNANLNTIANDYSNSFGVATSPSQEVSIDHGHNDNEATAVPFQLYSEDSTAWVLSSGGDGTLVERAEFTNFIDSGGAGFTLNWLTADATQRNFGWMMIKGGKWEAGNETVPTSSGTKKTTTSFLAKGLTFFGLTRIATNTAGTVEDLSLHMGFSDGTDEESGGYSVDSGASTMSNGVDSNILKSLRVIDLPPTTVDAQANVSLLESDGFTLNYTSGDEGSQAWKFGWIVCGDGAVAPPAAVVLASPVNVSLMI